MTNSIATHTGAVEQAVAHLRLVDPVLAGVIDRVGECSFAPSAAGTHFDAVVRSIVFQQLSGKAAATIHGRLVTLFGASPLPAQLIATPDEALRSVGLSRQKLAYLKHLALEVEAGRLPIETLHHLEDEAIVEALVRVRGVGRWTAQMFLMFRLGRLDVLPTADLGIQKGIQLAYGLDALATPKQVLEIGAPWRPYSTVASWYLWRSLEVGAGC